MSDPVQIQRHQATGIGAFVDLFLDPQHNAAGDHPDWCAPFRNSAVQGRRAPLVLPRLWRDTTESAYYVIARRPNEAGMVRDLLVAFAGPSLAKVGYDVPVGLDTDDVLEAQICAQFGDSSTFRVKTTRDKRAALHTALRNLVALVERSPQRAWSAPKPLGRLLTDFESALLGGAPQAAADLLQQIDRTGRLSVANLRHLQIKQLAVLGKASDVLDLPGLREILLQEPPRAVKELVLGAIYATCIEPALAADSLQDACQALAQPQVPTALLAEENPLDFSDPAATTLLVALRARGQDAELAQAIAALDAAQRPSAVPTSLDYYRTPAATSEPVPAPDDTDEEPPQTQQDSAWRPETWSQLLAAVAQAEPPALRACRDIEAGGGTHVPLTTNPDTDTALAAQLSELSDAGYENVWRYALAPFLQQVAKGGMSLPLTLAQITASSIGQRRDPANLAVLDLLLELFLRTSPGAQDYDEFLEHLTMRVQEWVASETASQALDFVDRLAAFATPDPRARAQTALELLAPLNRQPHRLDAACLASAHALSDELELGLTWPDWQEPQTSDAALAIAPAHVLVYGMDEGVLERVKRAMAQRYPQVRISLSAAKDGTTQLREIARHVDFSVLITQCATHATTNFITNYTRTVVYPHGAGSVSVIRAIVEELRHRARQTAATHGRN